MKATYFVGTAREALAEFPDSARRRVEYELFLVQVGREPAGFKPIPSVGFGAYEIRVRDEACAFRVIYVAKVEHVIYVLHAFRKTSQKTAKADIDLAARRYRLIGEKL
jgi:phage-related protein